MDLFKAIKELQEEKRRIERLIELLEEHAGEPKPVRRRGRKSMSAAERAEVSRRMREYWKRKKQPAPGGESP